MKYTMSETEMKELLAYVQTFTDEEQLMLVAWVVKLLPSERVRQFVDTCILLKENYSEEEIAKLANGKTCERIKCGIIRYSSLVSISQAFIRAT